MQADFIAKINNAIKWSFYSLFFLVPLIIWPDTFELFEFNKMWLVFIVSLFITFLWGSKMILQKRFEIRRTPLDIPILLFLLSQIISTIFSIDPHVSFWGYYSRFNGGLLSTISYIFLYYAFATNMVDVNEKEAEEPKKNAPLWIGAGILVFVLSALIPAAISITWLKMFVFLSLDMAALVLFYQGISGSPTVKSLLIILLSGLSVVLWGLPSHFGFDPTCFVFRGSPDVSCWTQAFQPTIRIFSTLGQPNWLGTYLAALIPIALGFGIYYLNTKKTLSVVPTNSIRAGSRMKTIIGIIGQLSIVFLFFLALLYTRSQSAFLGLAIGLIFFFGVLVYKNKKEFKNFAKTRVSKYIIASVLILALTGFFVGTPIESINKFTSLGGLQKMFAKSSIVNHQSSITPSGGLESNTDIRLGGSESSDIRLIVWQGAFELFKKHPIFGTGVETYAYAYYSVKPVAHNLTSEWDYLYNKAHNEYLNYLATSGIFGLGTYLLMVGFFTYYVARQIFKKTESENFPISIGIFAGYLAMLISNFFGFSVVIINLFIFIFPILFFDLENNKTLKRSFAIPKNAKEDQNEKILPPQTIAIVVLLLVTAYYGFFLFKFWAADSKYALGYNLDRASEYARGYEPLLEAVKMLPGEDLYKDELSLNMATLSLLLAEQKDATQAAAFGQQAKLLSDEVIAAHPKNIVFLKTRARVLFALSELDPAFLDEAILTVEQARKLAPTDAKLPYNEGLFYNQKGDPDNAIKYINEAIRLKPNYADAYYSIALIYGDLAKKNPGQAFEYKQKQTEALKYILRNIDPTNKAASDLLKSLE